MHILHIIYQLYSFNPVFLHIGVTENGKMRDNKHFLLIEMLTAASCVRCKCRYGWPQDTHSRSQSQDRARELSTDWEGEKGKVKPGDGSEVGEHAGKSPLARPAELSTPREKWLLSVGPRQGSSVSFVKK